MIEQLAPTVPLRLATEPASHATPTRGIDHYGNVTGEAGYRIGFFLAPTFSMLAYLCAVEALRAANRFSGRALYSWHVISADGQPVVANNRIMLPAAAAIDAVDTLPMVFACGPHDPIEYADRRVFAWLRKLARGGAIMGALDTGTYLLARAGLLEGYRCTIHWENRPGLVAEFPGLAVSSELYEIDRKRMTCAGGTAALDLMLHHIETTHGHALAMAVAELFIRDIIRHPHQAQRMDLRARVGVSQPRLLECIRLMETNVDLPLEPGELAAATGVSKRQIERLFRRYLSVSPSQYYLQVRLKEAHRLLEQTSMSIIDVAVACGFSSPGHFSHRFRGRYGYSPRQSRGLRKQG